MDPNYVNSIVTLIVGFAAVFVYWLTKRAEKRNAAIIIVMDIRHAEQVVFSILETGIIDKTLKNILSENNWAKYKHLFASDFSYDDFACFNRFFESCVEISDARIRMNEVFYANLNAKASIAQQKLFELDISDEKWQHKKQEIIEYINSETFVFDPNEPKSRVLQSLQLMGRLSNTIAFYKLKKIAKITS